MNIADFILRQHILQQVILGDSQCLADVHKHRQTWHFYTALDLPQICCIDTASSDTSTMPRGVHEPAEEGTHLHGDVFLQENAAVSGVVEQELDIMISRCCCYLLRVIEMSLFLCYDGSCEQTQVPVC